MRVLFVTANSHLRSTTSSLAAILSQLQPKGLVPVMLFRERGPWQAELDGRGIRCYFNVLRTPDKLHPIQSLYDVWRTMRIVRRERIDLIHCNEHDHFPLLRVVARWARLPIVVTLHWLLDPGFGHWAFRPPYAPSAIQFLSQAQLESSRRSVPEGLENRVRLLMSGLDIDDFLRRGDGGVALRREWGAGDATVVIGTASAIKPRKHLEDFVDIIAGLVERGLPVLGVIAGGGRFADAGYEARLRQRIVANDLTQRCLLVGNRDPITSFWQAIDFAVNSSEMEILSMSICECLACGKPTIAYDVGGNSETVPDPWCVVPFGDKMGLLAKAERLAGDKAFRMSLGDQSARHVREHFDAPVLAARQSAIYQELLGR